MKLDAEQIRQLKEILCTSYQEKVNDDIRDIWKEFNSMKKLVMVAMGGVILQVMVFIGAVALILLQRG